MVNKTLRPLLDELAALPKQDRDAVLALLSTREREQVLAGLDDDALAANPDRAGHSSWLRAILDGQDEYVTPAALAALSRESSGLGPHPLVAVTDPLAGELRRAAISGSART